MVLWKLDNREQEKNEWYDINRERVKPNENKINGKMLLK